MKLMKTKQQGLLTLGLVFSISITGTLPAKAAVADLPAYGTAGGALPRMQEQPQLPTQTKNIMPALPPHPTPVHTNQTRIPVNHFKIVGVLQHPDENISPAKMEQFAEQLRLAKIAGKTGLTLGELHEIAGALTLYYRKAGYILATVYIPPQTIGKDRVVTVQVREGTLGKILTDGNKVYSSEQLKQPFEAYVGKSVQAKQIQEGLLTLNSYPGLTVYGIFQPGAASGETDLVIKIREEKRFKINIGADNTGTNLTGREHSSVNVALNNFIKHADQLSASYIRNFNPNNGQYGSVRYESSVFSPKNRVGIAYSRNSFRVGGPFNSLNISGISTIADFYVSHNFLRDRFSSLTGDITFSTKRALTQQSNIYLISTPLSVLSAGAVYTHMSPHWGGNYQSISGRWNHGFNNLFGSMGNIGTTPPANIIPPNRQGGSGQYASGKFDKFTLDYAILQKTFENQSVLFRFSGQYSRDLLVSLEQFSLGGINSVRAYQTSEKLADKGVFGSIEYSIAAPGFATKSALGGKYTWGQLLQVSAFVDGAKGWLNDPTNSQKTSGNANVFLGAYGIGVRLGIPQKFSTSFQVARPIGALVSGDGLTTRYWLTFNYDII